MKLNIILCFIFILLIIPLTGCEQKYDLVVSNTDSDISPDFPKGGKYKSGHEFNFKVEIVTDVKFCPYLNDLKLEPIKSDSSVGGYNYYSFTMPSYPSTLALSANPFYVDKTYYFSDLYNLVNYLTIDNVKAIEIEDGYYGVDYSNPNNNPKVRYSENKEDIKYNLDILKEEGFVKKDNEDIIIDGGWYRKVRYITSNNANLEITLSNGYIYYESFSSYQYFSFVSSPAKYPDMISETN